MSSTKAAQTKRSQAAVAQVSRDETVPLESLVGFVLRRAHFAAENHYLQLAGENPLTPRQFGVLLQLKRNGPTTIAELGKDMYVDRNTIGEMVQRMVRRGLLARRTMPQNRRASEIRLAPKGEAALARAIPVAVKSQRQVLGLVPSKHRAMFLDCLRAIAEIDAPALEN